MKTRIMSMICGLMATVPLATNAQNTVKGVVINGQEPIYSAKIQLENTYLGTYSNANGEFKLEGVSNGDYHLIVSAEGFEDYFLDLNVQGDLVLKVEMMQAPQMIEAMMVQVIKADAKTPTTYSNLDSKTITQNNFGQDLPFLLATTPSTVVTSDAGAGVGYTGIRIRGVDPTRTNVTINGIPLNDSESHGVYWVNMPDFASSTDNIQVQRGVGTSSNGAAAFGASINLKTDDVQKEQYATLDNSIGSFNTFKTSVKAGTGLINSKFTVDTRLSKIISQGYIDRSSSDLKSFYLSGAWLGQKSSLRANIFSGKEKTYQAWYGTPESVINGDRAEIEAYADRNYIFGEERESLLNDGRTYNYYTYENEVDNYQQDHYQLHFNHKFNPRLKLNVSGHYTRGRGYYEQFRAGDDITDYGFAPVVLTNDTVTTSDLIRRRWLDNHFYGGIFSLNFTKNNLNLIYGGGANQYIGDHFGEVIWAQFASNSSIRQRYYDNTGEKLEFHNYLKGTFSIDKLTFYGDVQFRYIEYKFLGIDEVNGVIQGAELTAQYNFVNPKFGLMFDFNNKNNAYASVAMANREPVRSDFRESTPKNRPASEQLINVEAGHRFKGRKLFTNTNVYLMSYKDQLVLTGQINDVGGYTRTNVDQSYRAGLELEAGYNILSNLSITGNIALSQNKIKAFNEFVDNYDIGGQDTIAHTNTDLAFSPNIISSLALNYEPVKGLNLTFTSKYVGDQFLDNTSTETRKLDAYFVSHVQLSYTITDVLFKEMTFGVKVNNLFNELYENNGYTWGYIYGGERTVENFYYPQAGRNFLARLTINL